MCSTHVYKLNAVHTMFDQKYFPFFFALKAYQLPIYKYKTPNIESKYELCAKRRKKKMPQQHIRFLLSSTDSVSWIETFFRCSGKRFRKKNKQINIKPLNGPLFLPRMPRIQSFCIEIKTILTRYR